MAPEPEGPTTRIAADLEAVFDVPVQVSAVLGRARMEVGELLKLGPGTVLELDRKVGEAIDIYVNNRLVARGEVVLVEDKLGVTMTEIIKAERKLNADSEEGTNHAPPDRRHAQRPAHHRDQDRDGQGRDRHPRRGHRAGARRAALRPRRRPADGRRRARHPRPGAAARSRAHSRADRRLRHRHRRPRRGRRDPRRRQGIHPAAARSRADRRRARRRRRRQRAN